MDVTREDFLGQVGTEFSIEPGPDAESVTLELTSVKPLTRSGVGSREDPFSAEFLGPAQPVLVQSIYPMTHERLGTLELFIVPLGPDPETGGMRYEAVFN